MKWSEDCKDELWELVFHGITSAVVGLLSLVAAVVLFFVETPIPWAIAAITSVIWLGFAGWFYFVEYPNDKKSLQCAIEEEAKEEAARQKQLSAH